jgi:hypothetical protein
MVFLNPLFDFDLAKMTKAPSELNVWRDVSQRQDGREYSTQ